MEVTSKAFLDGEPMPTKYAYSGVSGGKNISVPISWKAKSETIKSFAISIVDPHPVARNWVHWLVVNVPKEIDLLPENSSGSKMPDGSRELYNSYGDIGYGGPQPPKGSGQHQYVITVYGLNVERLDLTPNTSLATFEKTIENKVVDYGKIIGIFER
jgi:Raf kinase inhibitor-like YbhB/YbcL family protein